jgi:hypothetical protein
MEKIHLASFPVRSTRTFRWKSWTFLACLCVAFQLGGDASAQEFRASRLAAPMTALSVCRGIDRSAGFTCTSQQRPFDRNDKIWFSVSIRNLSSHGQQIRHVYYRAELAGSVERGQWVKRWNRVRQNLGSTPPRGDSDFYMAAHKNLAPGVWKAEIFVGNSKPSVITFCIESCPAGE